MTMNNEKLTEMEAFVKKTGGFAFPIEIPIGHAGTAYHHGLTVRDYFAAEMLNAIVTANLPSDPLNVDPPTYAEIMQTVARTAYLYADAMIAERDK
jgi:hypothetical protein